jgi:hypothetical protein
MASENGDEELIEPVPIGVRRNDEFERHGCAPALTVALRAAFTRPVSAAAPFPADAPATGATATPA